MRHWAVVLTFKRCARRSPRPRGGGPTRKRLRFLQPVLAVEGDAWGALGQLGLGDDDRSGVDPIGGVFGRQGRCARRTVPLTATYPLPAVPRRAMLGHPRGHDTTPALRPHTDRR